MWNRIKARRNKGRAYAYMGLALGELSEYIHQVIYATNVYEARGKLEELFSQNFGHTGIIFLNVKRIDVGMKNTVVQEDGYLWLKT